MSNSAEADDGGKNRRGVGARVTCPATEDQIAQTYKDARIGDTSYEEGDAETLMLAS